MQGKDRVYAWATDMKTGTPMKGMKCHLKYRSPEHETQRCESHSGYDKRFGSSFSEGSLLRGTVDDERKGPNGCHLEESFFHLAEWRTSILQRKTTHRE